MFKLDQIKSIFNCQLCSKLLIDPVIFSCENVIWKIDLRREMLKDEIDKYSDEIIKELNETKSNYIELSKEENVIF